MEGSVSGQSLVDTDNDDDDDKIDSLFDRSDDELEVNEGGGSMRGRLLM